MSMFDWFLIAWWLFGTFITVAQIGKKREPISPLAGAIVVLINGAFMAGLFISRGVL